MATVLSDGILEMRQAHRAAYYFQHEKLDPDLEVCHTCDNNALFCQNGRHLLQGTRQDNMSDMKAKGC